MQKYRKKPVVIEAVRFTGGKGNANEILNWVNGSGGEASFDRDAIQIQSLEGRMLANTGDWVIKGIKGEFYPCKDDIFRQTYDSVDKDAS